MVRSFRKHLFQRGCQKKKNKLTRIFLTEKKLAAQDAALPKYEDGIKALKNLVLQSHSGLDKIKERIQEISPTSETLKIEIVEWIPSENQGTEQEQIATVSRLQVQFRTLRKSSGVRDEEFERNMRRIQNIMNMEISVEDKIKQLNRIEMDAKRNIVLEEEKVNDLKSRKN